MHTALIIGAYFVGAIALLLIALVVIQTIHDLVDSIEEPFADDNAK